jgi:hypothetical protein
MRHSLIAVAVTLALGTSASAVGAQSRVGADSATRSTRFVRDFVYGSVEGLAFAGVDQLRTDPPEWGKGWRGYGKRAASDIGEFAIQETVTEALAAAMDRPLDYKRCKCSETGDRVAHAFLLAITDPMPDGSHPLAVPRIVGAYAGSGAQAAWRPAGTTSRLQVALINGTSSLVIGGFIDLFHEFIR